MRCLRRSPSGAGHYRRPPRWLRMCSKKLRREADPADPGSHRSIHPAKSSATDFGGGRNRCVAGERLRRLASSLAPPQPTFERLTYRRGDMQAPDSRPTTKPCFSARNGSGEQIDSFLHASPVAESPDRSISRILDQLLGGNGDPRPKRAGQSWNACSHMPLSEWALRGNLHGQRRLIRVRCRIGTVAVSHGWPPESHRISDRKNSLRGRGSTALMRLRISPKGRPLGFLRIRQCSRRFCRDGCGHAWRKTDLSADGDDGGWRGRLKAIWFGGSRQVSMLRCTP